MPPKIRARKDRPGSSTRIPSISYGPDEEPWFDNAGVASAPQTSIRMDVPSPKTSPKAPRNLSATRNVSTRLAATPEESEPLLLPEVYSAETGATSDVTAKEAMDPQVAKAIADSLGKLQNNYGSLADMLAFQEQLTRRILERQDELERAFNTKLDEGIPFKFPGLTSERTADEDQTKEAVLEQGQTCTELTNVGQGSLTQSHIFDGKGAAPEAVKAKGTFKPTNTVRHEDIHHGSFLHKVVHHKYFEWVAASIILTHSIFISVYVEYLATVDADGHSILTWINLSLTFLFLGEVAIKIFVEREEFFVGVEKWWNIFDLFLIMLVFLQLSLMLVVSGKDKKRMKTVLKVAEMARTTRILRIFRFLKFSTTLQIIIFKIFRSMRTLPWVMGLMFMMIWVVAVCFTQGANDFMGGRQFEDESLLTAHEIGLITHFGSVGKSMKTCFASISGGLEWSDIYTELENVSVLYSSIFFIYIFAANFAMFNIITGIFMNDMHRADTDFEQEQTEKRMEVQYQHLAVLFDEVENGNGLISLGEFMQMAHQPVIQEYLEAVGIGHEDAHLLFYLIDEENTGEITIHEFLNGAHALTKASTGLDMKVILYESRHMRGALTAGMNHLDKDLEGIEKILEDLKRRLHFLSPLEAKVCQPANEDLGLQTAAITKIARPAPASVNRIMEAKLKKQKTDRTGALGSGATATDACTTFEKPQLRPGKSRDFQTMTKLWE